MRASGSTLRFGPREPRRPPDVDAPHGTNRPSRQARQQATRIIAITDKELRDRIAE